MEKALCKLRNVHTTLSQPKAGPTAWYHWGSAPLSCQPWGEGMAQAQQSPTPISMPRKLLVLKPWRQIPPVLDRPKMRSLSIPANNLQCRGFCKVRKKQKALLGKSHLLNFFFFKDKFYKVQTETLPGCIPASLTSTESPLRANREWQEQCGTLASSLCTPSPRLPRQHTAGREESSEESPEQAGKGSARSEGAF